MPIVHVTTFPKQFTANITKHCLFYHVLTTIQLHLYKKGHT